MILFPLVPHMHPNDAFRTSIILHNHPAKKPHKTICKRNLEFCYVIKIVSFRIMYTYQVYVYYHVYICMHISNTYQVSCLKIYIGITWLLELKGDCWDCLLPPSIWNLCWLESFYVACAVRRAYTDVLGSLHHRFNTISCAALSIQKLKSWLRVLSKTYFKPVLLADHCCFELRRYCSIYWNTCTLFLVDSSHSCLTSVFSFQKWNQLIFHGNWFFCYLKACCDSQSAFLLTISEIQKRQFLVMRLFLFIVTCWND